MATATEKPEIDYPESDGEPMGESGWHVRSLFCLLEGLRDLFADRNDVYVASNMFLYYAEGSPGMNKCPDCMVIFGVNDHERRVWKTWEEGATPSVIFEISSRETFRKDITEKSDTYAMLGVPEYYLFDPVGECLDFPLIGHRLVDGAYRVLRQEPDGGLDSPILGTRLVPEGKLLRVINPRTGRPIPYGVEKKRQLDAARQDAQQAAIRAEWERLRAEHERLSAAEERLRADRMEFENERLRAEIDRLKTQDAISAESGPKSSDRGS